MLFHLGERRGYCVGFVADVTEGLLVSPQLEGVMGMCLTDCLVESIRGGEVAEHSRHRGRSRQVIGAGVGL